MKYIIKLINLSFVGLICFASHLVTFQIASDFAAAGCKLY
jgi:hypothetical protein